MLISDRADFKARKVIRIKKGTYIHNDKGISSPRRHTILNNSAIKNRMSNYVRQKLIEFIPRRKGLLLSQKWTELVGRKAMTNLDSILKSRDITLTTKVHRVKAMMFPVLMYGCESWTIKKAEQQRIDASELWCWRRY